MPQLLTNLAGSWLLADEVLSPARVLAAAGGSADGEEEELGEFVGEQALEEEEEQAAGEEPFEEEATELADGEVAGAAEEEAAEEAAAEAAGRPAVATTRVRVVPAVHAAQGAHRVQQGSAFSQVWRNGLHASILLCSKQQHGFSLYCLGSDHGCIHLFPCSPLRSLRCRERRKRLPSR